nr:MAG TPA: hypothetical protein [Caudoviricetes sp.]
MAWQTMFNSKAFSPTTTLTQEIGSSDTRIYVADVSVFPAVPTLATIGIASDLAEVVKITAIGNNFIDVERGYVGAAKSFTANVPISRNFSSKDQDIIQANLQFLKDNALFEVKAENIPANSISNDKLAQTATNIIKGRKSASQGNVEDLSASDVRTMLDIQKGADVTNTVLEAAGDTTIADNDKLVLVDVSVSSGSKIRTVLWSAIKTALNNLFVPKTRTVNKKALSEDISLTAADVGADASGTATSAVSNHNSDSDAHSSIFAAYVKNTLKINNKALSSDISLSANDVGADAQGSANSAVSSHNSASGAHETLFDKKQDVPLSSSSFPTSGTALTANTIYTVSGVGTYAFTAPTTGNKWAHGRFTTGSTVNVSFSGTFQGAAPSIEANKAYEFDVFDSVWAVQEVVSG